MTAWAVLRRMLRRRRGPLTASYLLHAVWATSEALVPVVIGAVIDRGILTGDGGRFVLWLGVLAALMLVLSLGYRFGAQIGARASETEAHELRAEIAGHVLHPQGVRTDRLPGETLSLATSDADQVGLLLRIVAFALASLTGVVVVAVYLLRVDLGLGLLVLVGVPVTLGAVQLVTPLVSRRTDAQQELVASATGVATDLLAGLRPLKGIGGEAAAVARYRHASRAARDASTSTARAYGYLFGLSTLLSGVLLAVVALVAGRLALHGEMTLGELIAVVGLTQFLAEPMSGLGHISAFAASAHASAGRIAAFLAAPRLVVAGETDTPAAEAGLELTGLAVGPLRELTLRTAPGRFTAVHVDDPAAADALVDVLSGTRLPEAGYVRVGGTDLHALSIAARRAAYVVSPHHAHLVEGTLRSTVDPDGRLAPDALADVLRASAADDVVALHDRGLDAPVAASGSTLSGGQRQRLALARSLGTATPLLVLHDPTSAVDAVTERDIAAGVRALRHGAPGSHGALATVVITASPAFLDQADEVVTVRDGRTTGRGTHRELLARDPAYRAAVLR
ncbi:ABC transporter transmembrane domain-containing protein [Jatrophihabitans endophyticus]|nr:ABC transporter ATP-binding protein [Jatrophihabitans endophyticus]